MKNTVLIAHNAVNAKLVGATKEQQIEVQRVLSYKVPGSEHMASFRSSSWDGRSSFFSFKDQVFPSGFVPIVQRALKKIGTTVMIRRNDVPEPLGPEAPVVDAFGESPRYDFQMQAVRALVDHKQVIIQVATGGGKSRIARLAMRRIARRTLFLTTQSILMYQMHDAIVEMGDRCAVLGDGEWGNEYTKADGSKGRKLEMFNVGMVQTLALRLQEKHLEDEFLATIRNRDAAIKRKVEKYKDSLSGETPIRRAALARDYDTSLRIGLPSDAELRKQITKDIEAHNERKSQTIEVLSKFEFVIVEEAHEVSSASFSTVMAHCRSANYRMALTATPFMKADEEANMLLMASCGPVAVKVSEKLLIDRGILAKPYFKFILQPEAHRPKRLTRSSAWKTAYSLGVTENEYRNRAIVHEVKQAKKYGITSMALVQRKDHGEILKNLFEDNGLRAAFIFGENSQAERRAQLQKLGKGEIDVLIGSTILDVGVDVPSVGLIVLAGGGKAEVQTRQRIGRGLREKKSGAPNVAFVVDFADNLNATLNEHASARFQIIKNTPGFGENVVDSFDYEALGFSPK